MLIKLIYIVCLVEEIYQNVTTLFASTCNYMSFVTNFNSFYNYFPTLTKFGYFYIFVVTIKTPSSFHVNDIYESFHQ
jgi:hypothetical protein